MDDVTLPDRLSGVSGLYAEVFELFFRLGGGLIEDFFVAGLVFNWGWGRKTRLHSKHSVSCLNWLEYTTNNRHTRHPFCILNRDYDVSLYDEIRTKYPTGWANYRKREVTLDGSKKLQNFQFWKIFVRYWSFWNRNFGVDIFWLSLSYQWEVVYQIITSELFNIWQYDIYCKLTCSKTFNFGNYYQPLNYLNWT